MITIKPPFRLRSSAWVFVLLILLAIAIVPLTGDKPATGAALVYAVLVSAFLVAQLAGFILSQTYYSERIEEIKFDLLREEEREWAGYK